MRIDVNIRDRNLQFDISRGSMALRCRSFSKKNIEKKYLHCLNKNYYYFWKSNISAIYLIVGSRNMIILSKFLSL